MLSSNTTLTIQDFQNSHWQDIISSSERKECYIYKSQFSLHCRISESEGNVIAQEIYSLLEAVTSFALNSKDINQPFVPSVILNNCPSTSSDDINDNYINLFSELAENIMDDEMRARVADIVWVRKRDFKKARVAVEAYLKSAKTLENSKYWSPSSQRIERALRLGALLGKKNKYFSIVIQYIEENLRNYDGEEPSFFLVRLMQFLQEHGQGDPTTYVVLSEKLAKNAQTQGDLSMEREYLSVAAKWYSIGRDPLNERIVKIIIAETFVKEALRAVCGQHLNYSLATGCLEHAIQAFRKVGDSQQRIDELHLLLLDYQKRSISELKGFSSGTVDVSNQQEQARIHVAGKLTVYESLMAFSSICMSPDINVLRKVVMENAKLHPFSSFISTVSLNGAGKVIARRPSLLSSNLDESEAAIKAEMLTFLSAEQHLRVIAAIEPARRQIILEHNIQQDDLLHLVTYSPFVPPGREKIYAQGLYAGFTGDFLISGHLLIPQVENSLRFLLSQQRTIVSNYDAFGIQDEHNVNSLLYMEEFKNMVGGNIAFDLQGLLVERFGSNLRNKMAHGLMDYEEFYTTPFVYLWWIIFKLSCRHAFIDLKISCKVNEDKKELKKIQL